MKRRRYARALAAATFSFMIAAAAAGESLGGVRVGDAPERVEEVLGPPDQTSKIGRSPEMGGELWVLVYKVREIRVWFLLADADHKARVTAVSALGNSKAKTSRGIGIGSTKKQVEAAYGALTRVKENTYMATGANGVSLFFDFQKDVTVRVVLGRMPGWQ